MTAPEGVLHIFAGLCCPLACYTGAADGKFYLKIDALFMDYDVSVQVYR
jgi:hypothetical protein